MKTTIREDIDPVAEVRRIREEQAARCNYDIHAIFEDARSREGKDGRKVVNRRPEALAKLARGEGR